MLAIITSASNAIQTKHTFLREKIPLRSSDGATPGARLYLQTNKSDLRSWVKWIPKAAVGMISGLPLVLWRLSFQVAPSLTKNVKLNFLLKFSRDLPNTHNCETHPFFFFLLISHHVFFPNSALRAAVLVSHCWERLWWDRTDTCRSEGYLIAFSSRCSPKKQESTHRCRDRLQGSLLICSPGMWGCSIEALLFLLPPALADDLCQLHKSASLLSVHLLCTSTMFRICVFSSHVVKITFKVISGNIFFFFFFEWEGSWKMWGSS